LIECLQVSVESKLTEAISCFKKRQKFSTEQFGEYCYRKKEVFVSTENPSILFYGKSSTGNNAVNVRVKAQRLTPGMKHCKKTDSHSEVFGICSNLD